VAAITSDETSAMISITATDLEQREAGAPINARHSRYRPPFRRRLRGRPIQRHDLVWRQMIAGHA